MENSDFLYKRKPAIISFFLVYIFCFGISFLLIKHSPAISGEIARRIIRLGIPHYSGKLQNLPYGIIFSLPFLFYGVRRLLWNMMTRYEITSSQIRMLDGSLIRKERIFPVGNLHEITFKQSLIEAPFHVGSLVLKRGNAEFTIRGIYGVGHVVESIRGKVSPLYR